MVGCAEVTQYSAKQGAAGCKSFPKVYGLICWVTILGDSLHQELWLLQWLNHLCAVHLVGICGLRSLLSPFLPFPLHCMVSPTRVAA